MTSSVCHDGVMELTTFVATLRQELALATEGQGEQARASAERLVSALEPAVRLAMLEALSAAADEITRDLAPGSVHVRLRGREPAFVVTLPPTGNETAAEAPLTADGTRAGLPGAGLPGGGLPGGGLPAGATDAGEGPTARINVRLGEQLKLRIEQAAARSGLSVNAWLGRAAAAALDVQDPARVPLAPIRQSATGAQRYTGWAQ
jgi:hypothetical protein